MPPKTTEKQRELDLALIWLPSRANEAGLVASISERSPKAEALPLVVSTGFPTPMNSPIDGPAYIEEPGLLVPLLKVPLEDGLDIAYTATVDKGMIGVGIFLGSDLIGINSAHRDPLWPERWSNARGQPADEQLNLKLGRVSLGLSARWINRLIYVITPLSTSRIEQLDNINCVKPLSG